MRRLLGVLAFAGLSVFQGLPVSTTFGADGDGDQVDDTVDVCADVADAFQGDLDGDGVGDLCEEGSTGVSSFAGTPEGELVIGTDEADTLAGAGGDDALYGLDGDDTLDGGDGRDMLSGGPGADTMTGGPGCDVFAFDPTGDNDTITDFDVETDRMAFPAQPLDATDPTPNFGGEANLVVTFVVNGSPAGTLKLEGLPAGIEIPLLTGPCSTPPSDVAGGEVAPEMPKVIPPPECLPIFPFEIDAGLFGIEFPYDGRQVDGTAANDVLYGTNCSDVIAGDAHIDVGDGYSPEDEPACTAGVCSDDVINGLGGNDLLVGDKIFLDGEFGGNDTIHGGAGDDLIIGDAFFVGGCECADAEDGIGGNDTLFGDEGDDAIFGDGLVGLFGVSLGGNDSIYGGDGDDLLVGDGFELIGGAQGGDDVLIGGAGDDDIYGDAILGIDEDSSGGDDDLTGGAGDDILYGDAPSIEAGAGSDTFHYDVTSDFGDDVIADAGELEVPDTIAVTGVGSTDFADLDARSTVTDDGFDVLAVVFTDATKKPTEVVGSILIVGIGDGTIASWADIDMSLAVDVTVE